ncbi:MAG TPA: AMP-binding protein [Bacteriovoracaceae bacterium]|nr:AMP-binding protein [Bacteriovoracaceae bacterium]
MTHPWHNAYDPGVPKEIDHSEVSTLPQELEKAFRKYGDLPAFHNMGTTLSYSQVDHLSRKFASYLQVQLLLKPGERVAIMLPNILQYPVVFFGVLRAGLVAVNVNPLYTARELAYQLKDAEVSTIVLFENAAHVLQKALPETGVRNIILTSLGDLLSFPKNHLVNFTVKNVKKLVPAYQLPETKTFLACINVADIEKFHRPDTQLNDLALLQYTGGTTGVAKGAMLTHQNISANMLQARAWIKFLIKEKEEILITPLPLYHMFSLTANLLLFFSTGALNVLITNPKDLPGFVRELKRWKFTAITGVNTLFNGLLNNKEFNRLDFSNLKVALGGGMAIQKSVAQRWKALTGVPLIEAFGMTETSPAICINPMTLKDYNGFIGLPITSTEVAILDEKDIPLPLGETGEICVRGPQVMLGYWKKPEESKNVMTASGFFKTGDLGFMTAEGFVKIVDRKKDMIIVSGFNVFPNELEDVVCSHPKVLEAAVVGIASETSGEIVKLFLVKKDQSLTEAEIIAFCRENLTSYKIPRVVEFRTELPKSILGKILRKELKDRT